MKLKGTSYVTGAESEAVLNTLAFKNGRSGGICAQAWKENIWRMMAASEPKIGFLPDGITVPELMDNPP
jgi:hypothetical protein